MDVGRGSPYTGLLFPFFDRPEVGVPVLWYPAPDDAPDITLPTPFRSAIWDATENLPDPPLGTGVARTRYSGPLPPNVWNNGSGTAEQWLHGCSYEIWRAGGYTKACPNWNPPMGVNTVTCDDGSITVDPITGDVVLHLNVTHANVWQALQRFLSVDPAQIPVLVDGAADQAADLQRWRDGGGNTLASIAGNGTVNLNAGLILTSDTNPNLHQIQCYTGTDRTFAVANDGSILTNQVRSQSLPGTQTGVFPIYDASGALLGYVPVYNDAPPPPTDCQAMATSTGLLNRQGSSGAVYFAFDGSYMVAADNDTPGVYWTDFTGANCNAVGPAMALALTDGAPAYNVIAYCLLQSASADHQSGQWQVDPSSPTYAGAIVSVFSS